MTEIERHDWQRIIVELKAMYLKSEGRELRNTKLGLMIGLAHQSMDILELRGEPRWSSAQLLLDLHNEYLRKTSTMSSDAPGI